MLAKAVSTERISDEWSILAGLRFVLAFIVLWSHIPICSMVTGTVAHWFGPQSAVMGFFLISGYSIAKSTADHPDARQFYVRRAKRILPLAWVGMILAYIAIVVTGGKFDEWYGASISYVDWLSFFANVVFLNGIVCETCMYIAPLWSLSVELVYYAFAPLISKASLNSLAALIVVSLLGFVWHAWSGRPPWVNDLLFVPHLCLLGFWLLGFILFRHRDNLAIKLSAMLLPSVLMTAVDVGDGPGGLLTIQACTTLMVFAPQIQFPATLRKPLGYLGDVSYPLYIAHMPILILLGHAMSKATPLWLTVIAAISCSIAAGVILLHTIDYPIRRPRKPAAAVKAA